ncbi:hypothetical protein Hte_010540 [Hypoxylon texense]
MGADIEWIDLSKGHQGNHETRVKVRSHAMKATAASRKRNAAWGKRNLRQLPENLTINEVTRHSASILSNDKPLTDTIGVAVALSQASGKSAWTTNMSPAMPLSGLELLAAEIGIHVLDLSALTEIQCGWTACAILAGQRSRIGGLVSRRQPSYLYSVASRYGYNHYLDAALRCVAIRARRVLTPSCQLLEESESSQYVGALHSLQEAINDVGERNQPDVLCAINLLSLFELLHFTRQEAWALHTAGASRLIRARGPASFVSDLDIRILLSMMTSITHEFLRSNEACYFEEDPWQRMFQSFVVPNDSFSSRSQLSVSLSCIMVKGPRLARDVRKVVGESGVDTPPDLAPLRRRLKEFRNELLRWHAEYDLITLTAPSHEDTLGPSEDVRSELLATYYGLAAVSSRLMSAVSADLAEVLEDEAVAHATHMIRLERDLLPTNQSASFYISQKLVVAKATLATTAIWRESSKQCTNIIEKHTFRAWWSDIVGEQGS